MTFDSQERADALSGADLTVSLLASAQYFRQVAWTEPCPSEEHDTLLQQVIRDNAERVQSRPNQAVLSLAQQARDRLVEVYQSLVVAVARRRKFLFQSMDLLDVIQEGNIGLLKALDTYTDEVSRLYAFRVFAVLHVKDALSDAACDRDGFIRLPSHKHKLLIRVSLAASDLRTTLGRQPLLSEIADVLGASEDELASVIDVGKRRQVQSIQAILAPQEIAEDRVHFVHLYASSVADEDMRQEELAETFQCALETVLPEKQREVVQLRYGFDGGPGVVRSQELVAEMTGIGERNVSKYDRDARSRLEDALEPVTLPDGRLSCVLQDRFSDDYCTRSEVAALLGVHKNVVSQYTVQGFLPSELRPRQRSGSMIRVFKRSDVQAFKERQAIAPVKLATRRKNETLAAARRSASLPSVVA